MLSDMRFAVRTLRQSPGFTLSAVLALALGIGANTAVFSVVYAVLLKPLPYPEPDRLVRLYEANPADGVDPGDVSAGTFMDWRARSRTLENISMFVVPLGGELLWTIGDRLAAVKVTSVSPTAFAALGVEPMLGRGFTTDADKGQGGGIGQFVISYGLWQNAFGGAPDIVGRRILVEGRLPREIIGVMPRGFSFPQGTDAWVARPLRDIPGRGSPVAVRAGPRAPGARRHH